LLARIWTFLINCWLWAAHLLHGGRQDNSLIFEQKNIKQMILNLSTLPKIRHTVCQLSRCVSTRLQLYLYRLCLHVSHRNTRVNGANFVVNRNKTRVNTLKYGTPFKRDYTALFSVGADDLSTQSKLQTLNLSNKKSRSSITENKNCNWWCWKLTLLKEMKVGSGWSVWNKYKGIGTVNILWYFVMH